VLCCVLLALQAIFVSGSLYSAAITWNVADLKKLSKIDVPLSEQFIAIMNDSPKPPHFISLMLQESRISVSDIESWVAKTPYKMLGYNRQCDDPTGITRRVKAVGHGCNYVFVLALPQFSHVRVEQLDLSGWREKGTIVVVVKYASRRICFVSSHLKTYESIDGAMSRIKNLEDEIAAMENTVCEFVVWGGDFNLRNADWIKHETHKHYMGAFQARIGEYFSRLSIPPTGILRDRDDIGGLPYLRAQCELHGVNLNGVYQHTGLALPPTFQPTRSKKCPSAHELASHAFLEEDSNDDKRYACFKTRRGGNCPPTAPTHMCVTATRPLTWTDFFLYRNTASTPCQVVSHGGYYTTTHSDHFPNYVVVKMDKFGLSKRRNAVAMLPGLQHTSSAPAMLPKNANPNALRRAPREAWL